MSFKPTDTGSAPRSVATIAAEHRDNSKDGPLAPVCPKCGEAIFQGLPHGHHVEQAPFVRNAPVASPSVFKLGR